MHRSDLISDIRSEASFKGKRLMRFISAEFSFSLQNINQGRLSRKKFSN